MKQTIHIYNDYHLGDGIFMMNYFHQIDKHLIEHNIHVNYYCNPAYKIQLEEFVISCNGLVKIYSLANKPADAIDVWMKHSFQYFPTFPFNTFLLNHTNRIAKLLDLPAIESFFYTDADLAARYERLPESCKDVDILFINAVPQSGQYRYNKPEWDALAQQLVTAGYKIVSTSLIKGIPSTIQHSLTVKDIAAISTHAKYIIAVNSGPVAPCLNAETIAAVRKWFVFDFTVHYAYPTMKMCNTLADVSAELLPRCL
jgi:hypothetical protein